MKVTHYGDNYLVQHGKSKLFKAVNGCVFSYDYRLLYACMYVYVCVSTNVLKTRFFFTWLS